MFTDYNNMPTEYLVDLLAQETQKFTQLIIDTDSASEFEECKNTIRTIQAVIQARKEQTISDPSITFTEPDTSG